MNPVETILAIEAYIWREEREQKFRLKLAHDIALLSRQKRLPSLKSILSRKPTRKLRGKELRERKNEFLEARERIDLAGINAKYRKK